jgi:competence protein ComEC
VWVAVASFAAVVAWRWRSVRIAAGLAAMCLLAWTLSALSGGHDTIVG